MHRPAFVSDLLVLVSAKGSGLTQDPLARLPTLRSRGSIAILAITPDESRGAVDLPIRIHTHSALCYRGKCSRYRDSVTVGIGAPRVQAWLT